MKPYRLFLLPPLLALAAGVASAQIIIDHTCPDLDKVPEFWLVEARQLTIHYAHTSHGGQLMSGIEVLGIDHSVRYGSGYSTPPTDLSDWDPGMLAIFDGNPPWDDYIEPEEYWSTTAGQGRTEDVADTDLWDFSMWAWCGQLSWYSSAQVQGYLDTMAAWESSYPDRSSSGRSLRPLRTGHREEPPSLPRRARSPRCRPLRPCPRQGQTPERESP